MYIFMHFKPKYMVISNMVVPKARDQYLHSPFPTKDITRSSRQSNLDYYSVVRTINNSKLLVEGIWEFYVL